MGKSKLKDWVLGLLTSTLFFSCYKKNLSQSEIINANNINLYKVSCVDDGLNNGFDNSHDEGFNNNLNNGLNNGLYEYQLNSIVNGFQVTQIDEKRFLSVLLAIENIQGESFACSAAILDHSLLVTAAHCLVDAKNVRAIFHTNSFCSGGYLKDVHSIDVENYIIHSEYLKIKETTEYKENRTESTHNPDLALVKLKNKIPEGYKPQPVLLSLKVDDQKNFMILGYGQTLFTTPTPDSMVLRYQLIDLKHVYRSNQNYIIDQSYEAGLCVGDSGGPLFLKNKDDSEGFKAEVIGLVGINSFIFGDNSQKDICLQKGAVVRLASYREWLQKTASELNQTITFIE